ncbi:hypothetical protein ASE75_06635 [Sphingomonas sp. Leaf17]|uniref:MobA/MobL family protein n=1 Tax=Sphingomonas sp. Leaf17 TaxID=1735683 RepID=UPI0006F5DB5A|nr:MobA/MobL family protein [Sphingomonas sp. Leaf17]KQM65896.1 hypothetical protein ASE75_06635 [Sphingomonas sp. Leaf17]
MLITQAQLADARRTSFASPSRDRRPADAIDFKVRPISEDWMLIDRMPAYKTATCNVAYIWRDSDVADRFGPMPPTFAERRYELRGSGLLLPQNAPLWATKDYQIWQDADQAALATGDPTAVSAWHVMLQIPETVSPKWWHWMLTGFLHKELAGRGAAVAWAIHALEGDDKRWLVSPHAHAIVTARHWKSGAAKGQRHPAWIGSWEQQRRLGSAWRRRCETANLMARAGFRWSTLPVMA